jgi:hypothetical protein
MTRDKTYRNDLGLRETICRLKSKSTDMQMGGAESFRMESFRITLFNKTGIFQNEIFQKGIFQNGIFQKESFRKYFKTQPESFRMKSFRRNLTENIFSKT